MFLNKKLRKLDKQISSGSKYFSENDDSVTINVKSKDHEQIFSEYNYENKTNLNPNLCDYLWNNAKLAPLDKSLTIKIFDNSNLNKDEVESAIKTHYRREYIETKDQLKKINLFTLACMLIGVLFLVALVFLHKLADNYYLDIIMEIVAWVFIWEAVDRFFLEAPRVKRKCMRIQQLYDAKVVIIK